MNADCATPDSAVIKKGPFLKVLLISNRDVIGGDLQGR